MTWDMWCDLIRLNWGEYNYEMACILEQLLCEGKLPLVCERCGHLLDHHQFDIKDGKPVRTFCNQSCWDKNEHSLCPEYVGNYVEH